MCTDDAAEPSGGPAIVRRSYVFALKGELPVPAGGWAAFRHPPECFESADSCPGADCPGASSARFYASRGPSASAEVALSDMSTTVDALTGVAERSKDVPDLGFTTLRPIVVASAPWGANDESRATHFNDCFALAADAARALLQATGDLAAPFARQQLWHWYLIVDEDQTGKRTATGARLFEDAYWGSQPASPVEAEHAALALRAAWSRNPVQTYHDLKLGATRAARAEGDYIDAVLRAAAACEVLIKYVAWQISWEANEKLDRDPAPGAMAISKVFDAKPATLIGSVLSTRLGGDWNSQDDTRPIGGWRAHVARARNAVIHRGARASEEEAYRALGAMAALETHLMDALSARAAIYPRSALLLVGRSGLERRSAFGPAKATYDHQSLDQLLREYLSWIDVHDTGGGSDG